MAEGNWDKFVKRVQDDVTPPARPRPSSSKRERGDEEPPPPRSRKESRPRRPSREGSVREDAPREESRARRKKPDTRSSKRPEPRQEAPERDERAERAEQRRRAERAEQRRQAEEAERRRQVEEAERRRQLEESEMRRRVAEAEDQRRSGTRPVRRPDAPVARVPGSGERAPVPERPPTSDRLQRPPEARSPSGRHERPLIQQPPERSPSGRHERPLIQQPPERSPSGRHERPISEHIELEESGSEEKPASLRQELKAQAKVVPLDKLRKSGTQFVRVIDPRAIERIVGDSVRRALDAHKQLLTSEERAAIEKEATSGFTQLLADHKKLQAEKTQLEAEKSASEAQRDRFSRQVDELRADLAVQQRRLAEERERESQRAEGISFSREALEEMERRLRGLLRRMLDGGELSPAGFMSPPEGLRQFHQELDQTLQRLMHEERTRSLSITDPNTAAVDELEQRIAKLTQAIQETERQAVQEVERRAVERRASHEVERRAYQEPERQLTPFEAHRPASAYTEVQGISEDAPGYKWRSALLRWVFLENLELRGIKPTSAERKGPFPGRRLMASIQRALAEKAQARSLAGY